MEARTFFKIRPGHILLPMLAFIFLYSLWLLRGRDLATERFWIGNLTLIFISATAAFLAWQAHLSQANRRAKSAWGWISIGLLTWFVLNSLRLLPLPAESNFIFTFMVHLVYFLAAGAIWIGISRFPRFIRPVLSINGLLIDAVLTSIAFIMLLWKAWVEPLLGTPLSLQSSVLVYLLVDLVTLVVILNLFLFSRVEKLTTAILWIFMAVLAFSYSDLALTAQLTRGTKYSAGTVLDLGWVVGNLLILVAIFAYHHTSKTEPKRPKFVSRILQRSQSLLPIVSILLLGWYALINWQLNGRFDALSLWGTAILGLGLLVRQGFQAGENAMEQYARLVNSIAEPAFVCDEQGRLRLTNIAFLEIVEANTSGLLGQTLDRYFNLQPKDQHWLKSILRFEHNGIELNSSREVILRSAKGTSIPVLLTLRSIEAGYRQHLAYAGTAHDLRMQKQQQADLLKAYDQVENARIELERLNSGLEQMVNEKTFDLQNAYRTLEEQNKTLQQLDQLKSDFVSLVSHELRAPLTNIRGGIELLLATPNQQPQRTTNTLQRVQNEILRLSKFTETILDLSALDANRLPLYPEPLDLRTAFNSLQQYFDQTPGGERIQWEIGEYTPIVLADQKALHSVLFHLLDNAMKYANDGAIIVSGMVMDEHVRIQVEDRGPGIDVEVLPFIFERFYRANMTDAQTVYGHGLGLYMVKRFVEAMNGTVEAENTLPHGALFRVSLPLNRD